MFGGGQKKKPPKPRHAGTSLSSFGLMDVPGTDEFGNISIEDVGDEYDDELEAELNAIAFGGSKTKKPVKNKAVSSKELQNMVDVCMQDIESGDEGEQADCDDEDMYLLDELAGMAEDDDMSEEQPAQDLVMTSSKSEKLTVEKQPCNQGISCAGASLIEIVDSRIVMYNLALDKSKSLGESSKERRFSRALKTLHDLKRKLNSGKAVREEDIPPSLASSSTTPAESNESTRATLDASSSQAVTDLPEIFTHPTEPISSQLHTTANAEISSKIKTSQTQDDNHPLSNIPIKTEKDQLISAVKSQREKYKSFALKSKSIGDKTNSLWGLNAVKLCDMLIAKMAIGESLDFDISTLPIIPTSKMNISDNSLPNKQPSPAKVQRTFSRDDPIQIPENPEDIPSPDPAVFGAPPPPTSIEEALNQRLSKYRQDEVKAKEEGNASKARRLGRICKQYEDALKLHTRGKPIPVAELPTPPGFSPIPVADISTTSTNVSNDSNIPDSSIKIKNDQMISSTSIKEPVNKPSARPSVAKQKSMTLQEKQLLLLQKRQSMFKSAALEAKRAGQIEQAKEYLRSAKGFDKLIEAAKGGLPVDITTLPVPPQAVTNVDMGFTIISKEEGMHISEDLDNKSRQEMYLKLEADIKAQIIMCETNEKHFKMTGDIASANKFQQMSEHTKKDLDALRFAYKRGDPVPKFHYEVRAFSIIVCNTDLTDHEAELTLERGINYNVPNPKEVHTYCRIEFPYPKDAPFKDKTATVKDTNNPEYNHKIMIPVNIKEKTCQRVFKRAAAKIEVWSKGGFLRGDTMLGTASVKLAPLETACTLHDTFPLMDGRKAVGGKVEVQIKLRNAVVTKQVEKREEKWLVISFR